MYKVAVRFDVVDVAVVDVVVEDVEEIVELDTSVSLTYDKVVQLVLE